MKTVVVLLPASLEKSASLVIQDLLVRMGTEVEAHCYSAKKLQCYTGISSQGCRAEETKYRGGAIGKD